MPYKSKAQQKPDVTEKLDANKSSYKKMTEYVGKDKNGLKAYTKKHGRSDGKKI